MIKPGKKSIKQKIVTKRIRHQKSDNQNKINKLEGIKKLSLEC